MEKRLKVLIADDEAKVGQLVKRLIEWDEIGLECIGIAQDGQTAYDRIVAESPDIVITDIRMPVLTGLEMIQKASEQGIHCHFIVVSGYKYFDYAQKALKYGVEDYLLKPIDEVELNRQLRKIVETESEKRVQTQYVDTMEKRLHDSKYLRHKEFLKEVAEQTETDIVKANEDFGLQLQDTLFRALYFKLDRALDQPKNDRQVALVMKKLVNLIENRCKEYTTDLIVAQQKNAGIQVILNYVPGNREHIWDMITETFEQMKEYLSNFISYELTVGISEEVDSFGKIRIAIEMSRESVDNRLLKGTGRQLLYQHENKNLLTGIGLEKQLQELHRVVETMQQDAIRYQVHKCLHMATEHDLFASEYYAIAKLILREIADALPFEEGTVDWEEKYEDTENCTSVAMLGEYLVDTVITMVEQYQSAKMNQERKPVLMAIDYMKEHFADKITLEEVAELSGFNTNYFSELFKKETGENFSNYLVGIRMEEAKKLLRDTNEAVYVIGERVGYKDAKYFSQQFVKVVGIKPAEYRKLYY